MYCVSGRACCSVLCTCSVYIQVLDRLGAVTGQFGSRRCVLARIFFCTFFYSTGSGTVRCVWLLAGTCCRIRSVVVFVRYLPDIPYRTYGHNIISTVPVPVPLLWSIRYIRYGTTTRWRNGHLSFSDIS